MSELRSAASSTLVGILDAAAARFPDAPAHQFLATRDSQPVVTSFRELALRSVRIAGSIRDRVAAGRPVLVVTPASADFLPALAACFRLGSPAVPLYPPRPGLEAEGVEWITRVAGLCDAALVLAPAALVPVLRSHGLGLEVVPMDPAMPSDPASGPSPTTGPVEAGTPALLLFTSGSTGAPKGVVLTHGNLVGNIGEFVRAARLGPGDPMVTWLPNCHIAGLYTRLIGLFTGATTVEFPASLFLERPSFWPRTIARFGASISAAPNFAYDLVASIPPAELDGIRLDRWRLAISGGEVVRPATFRALSSALGPLGFGPSALTPYYGLTETLCSAVRLSDGLGFVRLSRAALEHHRAEDAAADATDALEFLGNGPALGSTRLAIVDPATRLGRADDQVGEIWVGGPAVTPGYLHQEALNAEVVRAVRADGVDGTWFRTGDLGFLRGGVLYVTGRLKEMVIVRGKNYYPADLEQAALSALAGRGVGVCAAFGVDREGEEQVALALELARGRDAAPAEASALAALAQAGLVRGCGVACGAVVVVPFGGLPRTATGKVQRGRCRSLFESGQWRPVEPPGADGTAVPRPEASLELPTTDPALRPFVEWLRSEIATVTGRAPGAVDVSLPLPALGVDSLGMVRLLAAMEIRFSAGVGIGRMLSAPSVVELARNIASGRSGSGPSETVEPVDYAAELEGFRDRLAGFRPADRLPSPPRRVLLTGATGFLGAYLLRDLLRGSDVRVRCLVRGADATDGLRRLLRKLETLPGWDPAWAHRLGVVHGSLDSPCFGLAPDAFRALAADTDLVLHNGANVNFVAPYPLLRGVNVTSNLAVLGLSLAGGGVPVHYVSTTAVFNGPDRDRFARLDEDVFLPDPVTLFSGYAQTKWVSEALWRVAQAGGLPVAVHRPGLVTGDATTGVWHTDDFLCRLLKGCLQMGSFPDLEVGIDMIPVDVVSRGIVAAVVGGGHGRAYHWTHPAPVRLREIAGWFAANGWEARALPVGEWLARIRTADESNALYPLLPFLLQRIGPGAESILEFFGSRSLNLGRANAAGLAEAAGLRCPDPLAELLPLYARHLVDTGYLPSPSIPLHPSANP